MDQQHIVSQQSDSRAGTHFGISCEDYLHAEPRMHELEKGLRPVNSPTIDSNARPFGMSHLDQV